MAKRKRKPEFTDEQLRKNVAYVAYCIKLVRQSVAGYEMATFNNWLDFLEGRTYAPGADEVWCDVVQPK